ncbi:MAG TPA: hypothetical protein VHP30_03850 [Ignavibacteriales bacterium]|nr:hypothetical protein [Ignavibacteriales bacterium]
MNKEECILFSGAAMGAESEFGENAEKYGIEEVNFTFEGHEDKRKRGIRVLNKEELQNGDVSLTYISKLMNRKYPNTPLFRKVLQTIWFQVNSSREVFVIGWIQEDGTVKGGTGWGAEFAKMCNKPLFVFDQDKDKWFTWEKEKWTEAKNPVITHAHFAGTGTRFLEANGKKAVEDLFKRSFK